jgi:hypothetical protein
VIYRTRYLKWWVYVVSVILFPIALLSLLARKGEDLLQVELSDGGGATKVEVAGPARSKVWKIVERWQPIG